MQPSRDAPPFARRGRVLINFVCSRGCQRVLAIGLELLLQLMVRMLILMVVAGLAKHGSALTLVLRLRRHLRLLRWRTAQKCSTMNNTAPRATLHADRHLIRQLRRLRCLQYRSRQALLALVLQGLTMNRGGNQTSTSTSAAPMRS
jgi:hypothetical protein